MINKMTVTRINSEITLPVKKQDDEIKMKIQMQQLKLNNIVSNAKSKLDLLLD